MGRFRRLLPAVALLLVGTAATTAQPAAAASSGWTTVTLRPLTQGQPTAVRSLNDAGWAVGSSGSTPVRWDSNGTPTALPLPEGCGAGEATEINAGGTMAGTATCSGVVRGLFWKSDLTIVPMEDRLVPAALNAQGVAVGQRQPASGTKTPFAFVAGVPRIDLQSGGATGKAVGVTSYGFTVGTLEDLPNNTSPTAVGWFGPYVFPLTDQNAPSEAVDVIESGYVLVEIHGLVSQAAVVGPNGFRYVFHPGADDNYAVDLNEHGIAVGTQFDGDTSYGTLFIGAQLVPISSYAPKVANVTDDFQGSVALNESAWIVGNGTGTSWLVRTGGLPTTG